MTGSPPAELALAHVKTYPSMAARQAAEQNYRWLATAVTPIRVPRLLRAERDRLSFEYISGRHAAPGDLVRIASHLGTLHAAAHTAALSQARLDQPFRTSSRHEIPDFLTSRASAVVRDLGSGLVADPALSPSQAVALLESASAEPAAFYKDANPRNFLIRPGGPVSIDFDDLTLAPFGYDLAKLVVTLAMTHGPLNPPDVSGAIRAYNTAVSRQAPGIPPLTWARLTDWAEIQHILTSPYRQANYHHDWPDVRPPGLARAAIHPLAARGTAPDTCPTRTGSP